MMHHCIIIVFFPLLFALVLTSQNGQTVLDIAEACSHNDVLQLLRKQATDTEAEVPTEGSSHPPSSKNETSTALLRLSQVHLMVYFVFLC